MSAPANPFAFPVTPEVWATHHDFCGMELRDWFAGQALPAVITTCAGDTDARKVSPETYFANKAYALADAMLAARVTPTPVSTFSADADAEDTAS